jgi:ribonuclease-3
MLAKDRARLETALGHAFREPHWLVAALTHSSRRHELAGARPREAAAPADNERLEFLGDAVLGLIVSEFLLASFPQWSEGRLTKGMEQLVSAGSLHAAAQRLSLGEFLQLGKGEEKAGVRHNRDVLADAYEAVVAAIYLDAGLAPAAGFVRRTLLDAALRERGERLSQTDPKSALQEWLQARARPMADYRVVRSTGPDHRKVFRVAVAVGGEVLATGEGTTKKEAEKAAARLALEVLERSAPPE